MPAVFVRIGAVICLLGVGLGAFGAHAWKDLLERNGRVEVWNKAVLYQFVHGLALLALGVARAGHRGIGFLFVAGVVIFSGSLYLLALTNVRWLGAITPIGGLCFLAGWCWLAWRGM